MRSTRYELTHPGRIGRYAVDETGARYGSIKVIGRMGSDAHGKALWGCLCRRCGSRIIVAGYRLRGYRTRGLKCKHIQEELS